MKMTSRISSTSIWWIQCCECSLAFTPNSSTKGSCDQQSKESVSKYSSIAKCSLPKSALCLLPFGSLPMTLFESNDLCPVASGPPVMMKCFPTSTRCGRIQRLPRTMAAAGLLHLFASPRSQVGAQHLNEAVAKFVGEKGMFETCHQCLNCK